MLPTYDDITHNEQLPEYKPALTKSGTMYTKWEYSSPFRRSVLRSWKPTWAELDNTQLKLTRGTVMARTQSFSLQYAEIGVASDYAKRQHVLRIRIEGHQYLFALSSHSECLGWLQAVQTAIGLALPLELRTLPEERRRRSRRHHRRRERRQAQDQQDQQAQDAQPCPRCQKCQECQQCRQTQQCPRNKQRQQNQERQPRQKNRQQQQPGQSVVSSSSPTHDANANTTTVTRSNENVARKCSRRTSRASCSPSSPSSPIDSENFEAWSPEPDNGSRRSGLELGFNSAVLESLDLNDAHSTDSNCDTLVPAAISNESPIENEDAITLRSENDRFEARNRDSYANSTNDVPLAIAVKDPSSKDRQIELVTRGRDRETELSELEQESSLSGSKWRPNRRRSRRASALDFPQLPINSPWEGKNVLYRGRWAVIRQRQIIERTISPYIYLQI